MTRKIHGNQLGNVRLRSADYFVLQQVLQSFSVVSLRIANEDPSPLLIYKTLEISVILNGSNLIYQLMKLHFSFSLITIGKNTLLYNSVWWVTHMLARTCRGHDAIHLRRLLGGINFNLAP